MGSGASFTKSKNTKILIGDFLTMQQIGFLRLSEENLNSIHNGVLQVGTLLFKGLFNKAPEVFRMFEFFDDDWESSPAFGHHCPIFFGTLFRAIRNVDDPEKFDRIVDALVRLDLLHTFSAPPTY